MSIFVQKSGINSDFNATNNKALECNSNGQIYHRKKYDTIKYFIPITFCNTAFWPKYGRFKIRGDKPSNIRKQKRTPTNKSEFGFYFHPASIQTIRSVSMYKFTGQCTVWTLIITSTSEIISACHPHRACSVQCLLSEDRSVVYLLRVTKFPTTSRVPIYMEHGEKTLKKVSIAEENLACYTWRISADTITSSSHQRNKATNSYQPSLQLWYNFWSLCREPIAHTSHNLHATLIGMLHYNGVCLKTNRWRPIKFNLIISRSKPSGNSHTAESAMHLSCCWSRRAPRKHIAAYKQQNVMTTIQMNHNEVLIELTS